MSNQSIVVFVSSYLDVSLGSKYSIECRREQTKQTIDSIHTYLPQATIIVGELSDLQWDSFPQVNLTHIHLPHKSFYRKNKSLGESYSVLCCIDYITQNNIPCDLFLKISGRYSLNASFTLDTFTSRDDEPSYYFRPFHDECFSTVLYALNGPLFGHFKETLLMPSLLNINAAVDIEHLFFSYLKKTKNCLHVTNLGVGGNISSTEELLIH